MALGLSYLSLLVQKSGCFKPQRRMLLDMSALNQNNKRLSRLAIISEHVAADKRKQFGTVWADFCRGEFSFAVPGSIFFWYLFIPSEHDPVCPFPSGLFTLRFNDVVLIVGCFDANGGCAVGGAPWLDELQMF